jgi:hypothetical protein
MASAIGAIGGALGSAGSAIGSAIGGASAGQIIGGLGSAASLLDGGGGDSATATTSVDPATAARYADLYNRGLQLYNTPFTPYTGNRVAGFTPDQLAAQGQYKNMLDQSLRFDPRNQLNELAGQGPQSVNVKSLLDGDIGAYQNPFTEQVIDNTLDDLNDARLMQLQKDQDAAIGRGAFGGSRSAILESETNKNFFDKAGDITSMLRKQGFDSGMNLMGQDINRQFDADRFNSNLGMQNRNFQSNLLNNQLADQYRSLGLFSNVGNQQQGLNQAQNDFDYSEFLRQINYPRDQLGMLQGTVFGMTPGQTQTGNVNTGTVNQINDALGIYEGISGLFS